MERRRTHGEAVKWIGGRERERWKKSGGEKPRQRGEYAKWNTKARGKGNK